MVGTKLRRGNMTKKSSIAIIIGMLMLFNNHSAKAQLPTVDFGNIAGTIGIVTQGITNVKQGLEVITNGSNLNAIIGDAVGTISKFASTIKGYVQDAQQAIEKAKQRIAEGKELYEKYKNEIEERKAKYQALLQSIPNYTNPNSYNDEDDNTSSSGRNNNQSSDDNSGSSNNNSGRTPNSQNSGNQINNGRNPSYNTGNTSLSSGKTPANNSSLNTGSGKTPANNSSVNTGSVKTPLDNSGKINTGYRSSPTLNTSDQKGDDSSYLKDNTLTDSDTLATEEEVLTLDEKDQKDNKDKEQEKSKLPQKENAPSLTVGRQAFGAPVDEKTSSTKDSASKATETITKTVTPNTNESDKSADAKTPASETISKTDTSAATSKSGGKEATSINTGNQFRVSPSATKDKQSRNTIIFSSRLAFAAETSNSNKGTGYDKNGVFIFNTKYCDKSVDDLLTENGTRECFVNIVNKINNKNSYYAMQNKEDCKKMVTDTSVALLAEAIKMKYEASNYQDTLDEQESLGGNSNNTRDDTQVLAMNYEQTQKLLNKLITLLSGETIYSITKEICDVTEKVLEDNEVDVDNGGK